MTEPVDCRIQGACVLSIILSTDYGVNVLRDSGLGACVLLNYASHEARSPAIAGSELSLGLHLILFLNFDYFIRLFTNFTGEEVLQ